MGIGTVYITGLIGNDYNSDGSISEKGVELIDVMEQVSALGEVDQINFEINSQGGSVDVGKDIRDFIATVPNAWTIAKEMCASIATVIHTAVPLQNRLIEEGTKYMIHNPWGTVSGDGDAVANYAEQLQDVEKDLETHYSKATGTPKDALSVFMKNETFLSNEQCLSFNFACEIIPKATLRAVAKLQTSNKNIMKNNIPYGERIKNAMAALGGHPIAAPASARTNAKAAMIETDNGVLETPFDDVLEDDTAMIDGVAANGTFTITAGEYAGPDGEMLVVGDMITVTEGVIVSFEKTVTDDAEALAALKAKFETMEAENVALKASEAAAKAETEAIVSDIEAKAGIGSNYTPPKAAAQFPNRSTQTAQVVTRSSMADRKASYKKK
jgi:ATP-dependent Clp protease protease subunit